MPAERGSCELLKRLIREVWAHGDEQLFLWCWEWLLHIVARPYQRPDTILAVRGEPGSGKTLPFDVCLRLILDLLLLMVEDEQTVLGSFNGSLAGKLMIVFEEAAFAGNTKLFEKLKHYATASTVHINEKYKPAYELPNYARLVIISNNEHFAHIKQGDRRYTVVETCDEAAARWKEQGLYEKLIDEWRDGGAERFVYEAMNHEFRTLPDSKRLVIQKPHMTQARDGQIAQSRNVLERTLVEFLLKGSLDGGPNWRDTEPTSVPAMDLVDAINAAMKARDMYTSKHHSSMQAVLAGLDKIVKSESFRVDTKQERATYRTLPPRLKALDSALEAGVITQDEFDVGGGGAFEAAKAMADKVRATDEARNARRDAHRTLLAQLTAVAAAYGSDPHDKAERHAERLARVAVVEQDKLAFDVQRLEERLVSTRGAADERGSRLSFRRRRSG